MFSFSHRSRQIGFLLIFRGLWLFCWGLLYAFATRSVRNCYLGRMRKFLLAAFIFRAVTAPAQLKSFIAYDAPVIAFTHARLADVENLRFVSDATVVVRNGIIVSVGGPVPDS